MKKLTALLLAVLALALLIVGSAEIGALQLPAQLKEIRAEAFAGATYIGRVVLPEGLESIGSRAFADSSVTEINLPDSITYIAEDAFLGVSEKCVFTANPGTYAAQWIEEHSGALNEGSENYAALDAPVQYDLTCTENSIKVSWAPVSGATGYNVYYSTSSSFSTSNPVKLCAYANLSRSITGLETGTTYYVWVSAYDATGEGPRSSYKRIAPVAKPDAPVVNEPKASETSITVSWGKVSGATGYYVYYSTSSAFSTSNPVKLDVGSSITTTINGLSRGTTYYIWVSAYNAAGEGTRSANQKATTVSVPAAPVQSAPVVDGVKITVSWSAVSGATGYNVYYGTTSTFSEAKKLSAGSALTKTVTGLAPGTTYYIWITAYNAAGEGARSSNKSAKTLALPAAPVQNAAGVGEDRLIPSWNAVSGASGYCVYYSTSSSFSTSNPTKVIAYDNLSKTITGLTKGTQYFIWVSAYNAAGEGPRSTYVKATPTAKPGVPVIKEPTCGETSITLSWNRATGATGYYVYYATSSTFSTANPKKLDMGSSLTTTINGLSKGTTYYFWVSAYNAAGEGARSANQKAATVSVPAAPTQSAPVVDGVKITVSWSAVSGANGYNIYYGTTSTFSEAKKLKAGSVLTKAITGLAPGTTYYIWVTAYNAAGEGARSSYKTAKTLALPAAPVQNAVGVGEDRLTASWSAVSGANGYYVYYSTSSSFSTSNPTKVLAYGNLSKTITGLTTGTQYFIWVSAYNAAGEGPRSTYAKATPTAKPVAPVIGTPKSGETSITINWNKAAGATGYYVYYSTSSSFSTSNPKKLDVGVCYTTTINNLSRDTTYFIWVSAYNAAGEGPRSTNAKGATVTKPSAPAQNAPSVGSGYITVSWNEVARADGYNIYYGTSSTFNASTVKMTSSTGTSKTIKNLTNGTTYYIWVSAYNASGESYLSSSRSATPVAAPAAPTLGTPTIGDTSVALSWNSVSGATGYYVYYATSSSFSSANPKRLSAGTNRSYTVTGLTSGTTYYFWVSAYNAAGEARSANKSATPNPIPGKPTLNTPTVNGNSITVSWNAVSTATSYNLYYSTSSTFSASTATKVNMSGRSKTISGLSYGTTYYFWVSAVNARAEGSRSDYKYATTVSATFGVSGSGLSGSTLTIAESTAVGGSVTLTVTSNVSWSASLSSSSFVKFVSAGTGSGTISTTTSASGSAGTTYLKLQVVSVPSAGSTLSAALTFKANGTSYSYTVKQTKKAATPTYRALLIGQIHFTDYYLKPDNCFRNGADVETMATMLGRVKTPSGTRYQVVKKKDVTKAGVKSAIESTFAGATENDVSLFFYASHGVTSETGYYYDDYRRLSDHYQEYGSLCTYNSEYISPGEITQWLKNVPGKVIVFIGTCGSGAVIEVTNGEAEVRNDFNSDAFSSCILSAFAAADPGITTIDENSGEMRTSKFYVMTAAMGGENSWGWESGSGSETGAGNHFTKWIDESATISGSNMRADYNSDGKLTLAECYRYVAAEAANQPFNDDGKIVYQHPQVYPTGSSYVLFTK